MIYKITNDSQVPVITSVQNAAYFVVYQGGGWKKVTYENLISGVGFQTTANLRQNLVSPNSSTYISTIGLKDELDNLDTAAQGYASTAESNANAYTNAQITAISTATQTALDGKANTVHSHSISEVTGLQTALDGKASVTHTHAISDVTGLQTALDAKLAIADETAQLVIQDQTTNESNKFVSARRFWQGIAKMLTLAWTWTAKQTFTVAPQFDSTTANTFLKVDSGKQVASYNPARGQFDMTTPANVTTVSNAYTKVLGTTTASELQDVTHPTNNRLVIANAGTYRISVSGSLQSAQNNRTYDIAIYLNGVTRLASQGFRVTVANVPFNFALDRIKTFAASDFIEVFVQERGNSSTITTPDLNLNVMQLI